MDADNYKNDSQTEMLWAIKAHHHAETYFKLISQVDASRLHLTKYDDDIYRQFKRYFKTLKVDVIKVDDLKSEAAKLVKDLERIAFMLVDQTIQPKKWRPFCNMYEGKIDEFNFATLLRIDCSKGYEEENTILVTRIQFYAVEIARNRRGLNKPLLEKSSDTQLGAQDTQER